MEREKVETRSFYIDKAGLKLMTILLPHLSAGITDMSHYTHWRQFKANCIQTFMVAWSEGQCHDWMLTEISSGLTFKAKQRTRELIQESLISNSFLDCKSGPKSSWAYCRMVKLDHSLVSSHRRPTFKPLRPWELSGDTREEQTNLRVYHQMCRPPRQW